MGNDKHEDDTRQSAGVELNGEKFLVVPSSVSENRVANTGIPKKGSEDMTHLLKPPSVAARPRRFDEDRDYRPDDKIEWVIDVEFEGSPIFQRSRILELFDKSWRGENGKPVLFGWSPEDKHWTYLVAADVPETYTKLALGWQLFDPVAKKKSKLDAATLSTTEHHLPSDCVPWGKPLCGRTARQIKPCGSATTSSIWCRIATARFLSS